MAIRTDRDRRNAEDLAHCRHRPTGERQHASRCGRGHARRPLDLARLDAAIAPFDGATRAQVRRVIARGRSLGRRPRVFGLVGDSVTADPRFLGAFSSSTPDTFHLMPQVRERLRTTVGYDSTATIIDYYRGQDAQQGRDSFRADRAARDGAHSTWALPKTATDAAPLVSMVRTLSPAVAIVMYGSNDGTTRFVPLDELAARFERQMTRIVDRLEEEGVVPVLSTLPRHLSDPTHPPCDTGPGDLSNWRWAVQNSRLSAVVAELACRRHLPLIDLRYAMDGLVHFGIGPDGSHPNSFQGGSARLDEDGLQCGFNVRNYLTLRMLTQLEELLEAN
ncbi:MAG: hypothetical protein JRI23_32055 [Deltaproteobacteria bacterium]|nr:hypothetical protein [Deltaproteobacteria bacterium]MBW2536865.1 hypothetical protein [Deltaproteobacteria bacterium]